MTEEYYKNELNKKNKIILEYKKEIEFLKNQNKLIIDQLERYKKEAYTDSLTHLNNRRSLENAVGYDSLILADIDHFKKINDKYGHDVGDKVLIEISLILKKYIRDTDIVCRIGGDEFVILLKNCDCDSAYLKAELLKNKIERLKDYFNFDITMSFGICDLEHNTFEDAKKYADEAMYNSKKTGRNKVYIYNKIKK